MKRVFIISLFVTMVTVTAFAQNGTIREMNGEVTLKAANSVEFVPAQTGSIVKPDTIVSTGFKSVAVIVVGSSTITVRPLTRLMLSEIQASQESENLNVSLQTGRVRVEVRPPAGARANVTVQSPSATASVRGTVFEMDTNNLDVFEGSVGFQDSDGVSVPVPAGSSSSVSADTTGSGGGVQNPNDMITSELTPPAPVGVGSTGETQAPIAPSTTGGLGFDMTW